MCDSIDGHEKYAKQKYTRHGKITTRWSHVYIESKNINLLWYNCGCEMLNERIGEREHVKMYKVSDVQIQKGIYHRRLSVLVKVNFICLRAKQHSK